MGKIERKYMAHFIDAGTLCKGETESWERLGKDLEEYNVELNPDTETKENAEDNSTLFEKLQQICDNLYKDDNLKTKVVEAHLWKTASGGGYEAYQQDCYVVPTSYGGDTSGYQIPFTVNYVGTKTKGTFNPETKKFTAGE